MMPSVVYLYAFIFSAALGCMNLAVRRREQALLGFKKPLSSHRCRARPLFSQVGTSSFQLDAVVEICDDPTVPPGTPFSLRLTRPTRRSDYLFSKVRASVERGHALFVDVEDYLTARKARLCANGWMVVLNVDHSAGWPICGMENCVH
jgi:hypothetical protein